MAGTPAHPALRPSARPHAQSFRKQFEKQSLLVQSESGAQSHHRRYGLPELAPYAASQVASTSDGFVRQPIVSLQRAKMEGAASSSTGGGPSRQPAQRR